MIVTDDDALAARCRDPRNLCFGRDRRFRHEALGSNHRMTNLQAALGLAQLEQIDGIVARKRGIGRRYAELLADVPGIAIAPIRTDSAENAYWVVGLMPDTLLDLGCGAGHHALAFAEAGVTVTGVDMSEAMLAAARRRHAGASAELARRMAFAPGDARTVRLGRPFDAVVALFHVMSYQTSEADLAAAIATAAAHLPPGGLFGFDVWYGPAVLAQPPEVPVRRAAGDGMSIVRLTEPQHWPESHLVDVNFTMFVRPDGSDGWRDVTETHRMRYWFDPEIEAALAAGGFAPAGSEEWMTGRRPGPETFSVFHLARRL